LFFSVAYLMIFNLTHWIFAMNYYLLAKRIQGEHEKRWIYLVYYGMIGFVVVISIICLCIHPSQHF